MLTAELELSYIDTGSFQGQVHGQVLQIVDIFMCQTLKYLNIDCLILIMTVTCKNNLHCKYHKLFPPCVAPEPKWKMTCPACAAVLVLPPSRKMFRAVTCFFSPKAVTKEVTKAVTKSRPCHGRGAGLLSSRRPHPALDPGNQVAVSPLYRDSAAASWSPHSNVVISLNRPSSPSHLYCIWMVEVRWRNCTRQSIHTDQVTNINVLVNCVR